MSGPELLVQIYANCSDKFQGTQRRRLDGSRSNASRGEGAGNSRGRAKVFGATGELYAAGSTLILTAAAYYYGKMAGNT
jgi:hypothetical protein